MMITITILIYYITVFPDNFLLSDLRYLFTLYLMKGSSYRIIESIKGSPSLAQFPIVITIFNSGLLISNIKKETFK